VFHQFEVLPHRANLRERLSAAANTLSPERGRAKTATPAAPPI
jgi:hypothetical protein